MVRSRGYQSAISTLLVVLLLSIPIAPVFAASAEEDACVAGQTTAKASTSGAWLFAGCLGGWIGLICAYMMTPNPPAMALVGKSPEYVAKYTDCYREAAKSKQTGLAWTSCLVATAAYVAVWVAIVASFDETDTNFVF
jgi:hypothetical protein